MNYKLIQAKNMKQAMIKIHQEMGPNALIYRTRNRVGGIEVLVGVPEEEENIPAEATMVAGNAATLGGGENHRMEEQLLDLNNKISGLYDSINKMNQNKKEGFIRKLIKLSALLKKYIPRKKTLNQNFQYARNKLKSMDSVLNLLGMKGAYSLKAPSDEIIHEQTIRALVGPTGVGKTTTLIKIAVQFSTKYDLQELGIISTNIDDLYIKNKLNHFCDLYKVDYIHINSLDQLNQAIEGMRDKRMILIDTHGISQRDVISVNRQKSIIDKSKYKIATYLTLSASQQPEVIEDVIRHFTFKGLAGCILTKVDEALRIEPALDTIAKCKLPVAYVCNGEDLDSDIYALSDDYQPELYEFEKFSNLNIRKFSTQSVNWV